MDKILVLDFGSQTTHLIARRVRQLGVYSDIVQPDEDLESLEDVRGIILSGGPSSVYEKDAPKLNKDILNLNIPILGICYGHQLMCQFLGGKVRYGVKEYGSADIRVDNQNSIFQGLSEVENVWMSHGDYVEELPKGFVTVASTGACENAAVYDPYRNIFGLQFHPEVTHTVNGMKILENFIKICNAKRSWNIKGYIDFLVNDIKTKVLDKKVFLLVSGGVDSTVAFALLQKALGEERVVALHINNGLMRLKESDHIRNELKQLDLDVFVMDASEGFLNRLQGVVDPEKKRHIIGNAFVEAKDEAIKQLGLYHEDYLLGQGTIYPDTIESGKTKHSVKIKTHHNRVPIIQELIMQGRVIEPLKDLYKDEVRELGLRIGLPPEVINRHPFPGPGLGVRCLCLKNPESVKPDVQYKAEVVAEKYGLGAKVLPIKSVGVQGDSRSYKNPVALIGRLDWDVLDRASRDIVNSIKEVNRAVYFVAGEFNLKPQQAYLTKERLNLLRMIDFIVRRYIWIKGYYKKMWQMPVVLIPLMSHGKESIVLRPVCSTEVMTASFTKMRPDHVKELARNILATKKISAVFYDITNKPPGTVEWE